MILADESKRLTIFLSTPSGWRATLTKCELFVSDLYFYPRPPGGGRPVGFVKRAHDVKISIHALRVEGDLFGLNVWCEYKISIHALRVEGDSGHL